VTVVVAPTAPLSPASSFTPTPEPTPAIPATSLLAAATLEIAQPARPGAAAFAQYALEMRRLAVENGDQAYGAAIARAERVEAIRNALRRWESADRGGCVIYSTSRPRRMCETAAYYARLMYVSGNATDASAPGDGAC